MIVDRLESLAVNRVAAAVAIVLTWMGATAPTAWAAGGTFTGKVSDNTPTLKVRGEEGTGSGTKKPVAVLMSFDYNVDTDVTISSDKLRMSELDKGWIVAVNWEQAEDEKAAKTKTKNRNPMLAKSVKVNTRTQVMTLLEFESDKLKVSYEEEVASARPGMPSSKSSTTAKPRKRIVKADLYNRAKFYLGGEEIKRSDAAKYVDKEFDAEIIETGGSIPLIYKVTFREAAQ